MLLVFHVRLRSKSRHAFRLARSSIHYCHKSAAGCTSRVRTAQSIGHLITSLQLNSSALCRRHSPTCWIDTQRIRLRLRSCRILTARNLPNRIHKCYLQRGIKSQCGPRCMVWGSACRCIRRDDHLKLAGLDVGYHSILHRHRSRGRRRGRLALNNWCLGVLRRRRRMVMNWNWNTCRSGRRSRLRWRRDPLLDRTWRRRSWRGSRIIADAISGRKALQTGAFAVETSGVGAAFAFGVGESAGTIQSAEQNTGITAIR